MIECQQLHKNILDQDVAILVKEAAGMSVYSREDNILIDEIMDIVCVIFISVGCPQWEESPSHKDEIMTNLLIVSSTYDPATFVFNLKNLNLFKIQDVGE